MLFKKMILLFIVCAMTTTASTQRVSIAWSDKIKATSGFTKGGIYATSMALPNQELLTAFRMPPAKGDIYIGAVDIFPCIKLVKFNKQLEPIKELDFEFPRKGSRGFLDLVKLQSNYFLLSYSIDKATASMSIDCQKLNTETLTAEVSKNIATLQLGDYDKSNSIEASDLQVDYSPDSTKLLFAYEPDLKKKENKEVVLVVANSDMILMNEQKYSFGEQYKKVRLNDASVDNNGKIYLSYNLYSKDYESNYIKKDGSKIPSFTTNLCIINGKEKDIFTFASEGKFIHGSTIAYDENYKICIIGLYKEKHDGRIVGVFKASIDEKKKIFGAPVVFEPFPQTVLDQADIDDMGKKKGKEIGLDNDFQIKYSISVLPEGGIRLISEYHDIAYNENFRETWGDILVATFFPGNKTKTQFTLISKKQLASYSSMSARLRNYSYKFIACSFEPVLYNNKLLILYNDHEDNQTRDINKKPEEMTNPRKSSLMMAEINPKGIFVKNNFVLSHRDYDGYMTNMQFNFLKTNTYSVFALNMGLFKYGVKVGILTIK